MRLYFLLSIIALGGQSIDAQNFTEVMNTPFEGVLDGSIAFSDVDGDNDKDLLITGAKELGVPGVNITKLYINDGLGNFTEVMDTPFEGVSSSSVAFSDVDGDSDEDVLITGLSNTNQVAISRLYINDGLGNFTEVMDTPFEGVSSSSVAFSDIDGDNDQDVLITGYLSSEEPISKLYLNDGSGTFVEVMDTSFEPILSSSVAFSDVDGDSDEDVLLIGNNKSFQRTAKLYLNDGLGNFTEVMGTPFEGIIGGSIAFSDVDSDNDQDVLIMGFSSNSQPISKLYDNDGSGNFTEAMNAPFQGVIAGSFALSDVDGDNDEDVLIAGFSNGQPISKLYLNDGSGTFTEVMDAPFEGVTESFIAFSDVDGDNDEDVLITGVSFSNDLATYAILYTNDQMTYSIENIIEELQFDFILRPNPSSAEKININLTSVEGGLLTITILDANGRRIKQQQEQLDVGEQNLSLDVRSLTKGSYFIQLSRGERTGIQRLLIH